MVSRGPTWVATHRRSARCAGFCLCPNGIPCTQRHTDGVGRPDGAWRVLLLNAQRAQDCFECGEDFGYAFIIGRRQWVASFRADPLGGGFDEAQLRMLLAPNGEWYLLPWSDALALSPGSVESDQGS